MRAARDCLVDKKPQPKKAGAECLKQNLAVVFTLAAVSGCFLGLICTAAAASFAFFATIAATASRSSLVFTAVGAARGVALVIFHAGLGIAATAA